MPGLAAKPILDVAVGLSPDADPAKVVATLEPLGWIFRGDKGAAGLLLVLEDHPSHRVARFHMVGFGDARWHRYLALRDRLRADVTAQTGYAELERDLAEHFAGDRAAYTAANTPSSPGSSRIGSTPTEQFRRAPEDAVQHRFGKATSLRILLPQQIVLYPRVHGMLAATVGAPVTRERPSRNRPARGSAGSGGRPPSGPRTSGDVRCRRLRPAPRSSFARPAPPAMPTEHHRHRDLDTAAASSARNHVTD
jgi:GrpB protein